MNKARDFIEHIGAFYGVFMALHLGLALVHGIKIPLIINSFYVAKEVAKEIFLVTFSLACFYIILDSKIETYKGDENE